MFKRLIASLVCLSFIFSNLQLVHAQDFSINQLPVPGSMVNISSAFVPLMITGLTVHADNPLLMDFIVSTGNSGMTAGQVKKESDRLIKYFLACLTIPEDDQWVNLSPYEKQRIVPEDLGQTVLGQDMLAQDYLLKQLTASLIYPEKNLGKNFWDKVYAKANEMYGTSNIPVNTFNKVWILPDTAKVYEHKDTVFVVKSHLKVMLDEDYLALSKHMSLRGAEGDAAISERTTNSSSVNNLGSQIVREIILPAIEQEVNTGKNFSNLRQIYNSMILAVWFKKNLKQALLNQVYTDKAKVNGVNVNDPAIKEKIYKQYLRAYKKGVFNYIKEEVDQNSKEVIPRKYFSGGLTPVKDLAMATLDEAMAAIRQEPEESRYFTIRAETESANGIQAVSIGSSPEEIDEAPGVFDPAMTTPTQRQIERGLAYQRGEIASTPITRPFRASRREDVPDITELPPSEALNDEKTSGKSILKGEGVIAMLVSGASSRMNVMSAPPEVLAMSHESIQSKAGVPIGEIDGEPITYLDAFGRNFSRLLQGIKAEAQQAGLSTDQLDQNEVLLMTNERYKAEQEGIIAAHQNYGLQPQQIRFFNQPLEPIYWATPADVEKLRSKFSDSDYQVALAKAMDVQNKITEGEQGAVVVPNQEDPLGHGEFFHQLIISGELLHWFDTGKKWFFVKNVDNYAAKFDRVWLQILGRFLNQHNVAFQPEVSPRSPGQSGGNLIVMTDTGSQQLVEDPNLRATVGPDGQMIVAPADTFWFNDAVAIGRPEYVASLYQKPGQTLEEFLAEYRQAVESKNTEALEDIAERGRAKFPKLLDPKLATHEIGVTVKIETNMWQSTGVAPANMHIQAIGVRGARNFDINAYPSMSPQEKQTALANLRMLATKQWDVSSESRAETKQKLATALGKDVQDVTEAEVDLTLESYQGNKRISDDLLNYILHADLVTKGMFSTANAGEANPAMKAPNINLKNPFGNHRYWLQQVVQVKDLVEDMFRDYDYRFEKKEELNPAIVFRLGLVWAKMALEKAEKAGIKNRTVLIARDARKANPEIMDALVAAMRYSGLDVIYTAADTPNAVTSYSWAVQQYKPLMSIFHTASHVSRPSDVFVRGFKVAIMDEVGSGVKSLTTKEIKQYSLPQVKELLASQEKVLALRSPKLGSFRLKNVDDNVIRFNDLVGVVAASNGSLYELGEAIRNSDNPVAVLTQYEKRYQNVQPLKGIKVVVDGSHTPSGLLAVRTFEKLGAEVVSLNTDIQDIWGEHNADPSVKKNLAGLESKIKETGAHFGLAFDLDGDRGAILVPESTGEVAYKEFHSLAPDNLLGVLLPSLVNQWGYKDSGKELAIIRDVLGTHAVNDRGKELGIDVFQTDAGYPFLKAKKEELEKKGIVVPMYGERSGHTWLHVSGEIENPLAVAVLFAVIAKQKLDPKALNPVFDVYQSLTIPYSQSPRFQPLFHPDFLKALGESPENSTSWRYDPNNPTNPPQMIIGLGKDRGIKLLKEEFVIGKSYGTPAGNLTVKEFNSYADPQDEGGLNRYADIVFEQDGKFAGRFVFRASSNDPTFVTSYEAPQWENEDIQATNNRKAAIAKIVLGFLMKNNIALVTKRGIGASLRHLTDDQVDSVFNKSNLAPVEADLNDEAMLTATDEVLPREDGDVTPFDAAMVFNVRNPKANTKDRRMSPDKALVVEPGGIDLNSRALNMESSGQKVNITFDPAMITQFKRGDFSGVRIQILDVVPVNLMPLLGLREDEEPGQLAKA